METCHRCLERWFDLKVEDGECAKCRNKKNGNKFRQANKMDPGDVLDFLPKLTQIEEILISPVHALVSLYQIRGGQFKYSGHCCNFARDIATFHNRVPLLPEECDIIIMRRKGVDAGSDEDVHEDFRVRRDAIQQWLEYLQDNHPSFRSRSVAIDWDRVNNLPQDGSVRDRLRTIDNQVMPEPGDDAGPPEESEPSEPQDPHFTRGFVPNVTTAQTEIDRLRAAAFDDNQPIILTVPNVHGTPINEHAGNAIAINAFPTLFPLGHTDFTATREIPVTMTEWAAHLMRYRDGRFACHPRFRYWALNTIMRHDAKKASKWYATTHKDDRDLTVEDIKQML
ncbi:hypothetical protein R3P38DRAFT_2660964, partial [Favolaschia claudopus]